MLIDILISDEDLQLDEPRRNLITLTKGDVIAQDVKHRIIESGLLPLLLQERSPAKVDNVLNLMIIEVENDMRVIAGETQADYKKGRVELRIEVDA
jgi:hypothetical protein